ncbi:MAG: Nucleotidyltransferase domain [Clostridia bacterium]|nr:Nucleotidyltransferase domain [Clostridia bacterium]
MNILNEILLAVQAIAKQYITIQRIVLFGSRVREDNDERSDIDLAIFTEDPFDDFFDFQYKIENDVHTLLKFDIVLIDTYSDKPLLNEITKDGVIIYEKC